MKIVFTGDVILDRGVKDQLKLHGDTLLTNSFRFLQGQDFLAINLEGTLTDSGNVQDDKYNFRAEKDRVEILAKAGVTHASVSNNHIYDYGEIGYSNTIKTLNVGNIVPLGNTDVPTIVYKGDYQCAILSVSLTTHNDSLPISNIDELKSSIELFMKQSAEVPLIIYIHWGSELQPTPQEWQVKLAAELIEMGVDAIIGHHPHVTQTIEFINNKPVFYSIGNFVADAYLPNTDLAYVVELEIADDIENISIRPVELERYFPNPLSFQKQLSALKSHLKYSNVSLCKNEEKWTVKQTCNVDFSENTDLWMIGVKNTISTIKRLNANSYVLSFEEEGVRANVLKLNGELSEFQIADINNDRNTDVLIGISKKVKFDPQVKKRINIYTFKNNALKSLWLGTKFIDEIVSFDVVNYNNLNYLATIEKSDSTQKIERIYEWDNFGFGLIELNKIDR